MDRKVVYSSEAPGSALYSQGIQAGSYIYVSGFVGTDSSTKKLAGDTIEQQTRQAIINCKSVLRAAGSDLEDVVQCTVLLRDPEDFDGMNKEYAKLFTSDPPARMVAKLGVNLPGVRVSIAMTAIARRNHV